MYCGRRASSDALQAWTALIRANTAGKVFSQAKTPVRSPAAQAASCSLARASEAAAETAGSEAASRREERRREEEERSGPGGMGEIRS